MKSPRSYRTGPPTPWKTWAECPATRVAPASRSVGAAARTWETGASAMFGPQWGIASTASASRERRVSTNHSGTPARRSAKATPGRPGPAAKSRGWSVAPTTPSRNPRASSVAGALAEASSGPAPTCAIPARPRCSRVSARASSPKSSAWLLAQVTQSTPSKASTSTAAGGARKKKGFPGAGQVLGHAPSQHGVPGQTHRDARTGHNGLSCPARHFSLTTPRTDVLGTVTREVCVQQETDVRQGRPDPAAEQLPPADWAAADEMRRRTFTVVEQGYDQEEVSGYLTHLAEVFAHQAAQLAELRQAAAEVTRPAAQNGGGEASGLATKIADVLKEAEEHAARLREEADGEAKLILAGAQQR